MFGVFFFSLFGAFEVEDLVVEFVEIFVSVGGFEEVWEDVFGAAVGGDCAVGEAALFEVREYSGGLSDAQWAVHGDVSGGDAAVVFQGHLKDQAFGVFVDRVVDVGFG